MDLLTTPVSVYNRKGRSVPFTMRSASSPLYHPTHRLVLGRLVPSEVKEQHKEEALNTCSWQTGPKKEDKTVTRNQARTPGEEGGTSDLKAPHQLNHNDATACGRHSLPGRNKTLDWRGGLSGPEQGPRAADQLFSSNQTGLAPTTSESLEGTGTATRDTATQCTDSRVMSKIKAYNTAGGERSPADEPTKGPGLSHVSRGLGASWGQSLPSRLRSPPSSGSRFDLGFGFRDTTTDTLSGPSRGQSIWERIEKLYGSSGAGKADDSTKNKRLSAPVGDWLYDTEGQDKSTPRRKSTTESPSSPTSQWSVLSYEGTAGGTFPRHFPRGERTSPSSPQNNNNPAKSVHSGSPGPAQGQARRQMAAQEGVGTPVRGALEMDTRSPDKGNSKFAIAVQIRTSRVARTDLGELTQPHTLLEREASALFKNSPGRKDGIASGSGDSSIRENIIEGNINEKLGEVERIKERGPEEGLQEDIGIKRMRLVEDVFENSMQKVGLNTTGGKTFPEKLVIPSATSVRNKIHQFEVLTQRAQGSPTGRLPIRAFSVPAQHCGVTEGVKKSGSDNAIGGLRDSWQPLREEGRVCNKTGEEWKDAGGLQRNRADRTPAIRGEKTMEDGNAQRGVNIRSMVVDEVGLRQGHRDGNMVEREGNNVAPAYSRLKNKLVIPQNKGSRRPGNKELCIDETDFCKVTNPGQSSDGDIASNDTPSFPRSCPKETSNDSLRVGEATTVQNRQPSGIASNAGDDDKTPTNPPNYSPFLSHHPLYVFAADTAGHLKHSTPVSQHTGPSPGIQLTSSSQRSLPDPVSPVVTAPHPKEEERKEHLDTWVTSFNQKLEDWSDGDDDDEGTEKDEDSNYDSDSAESSVTITSNMSQSDRRSFCVSLADLCNFGGVEYESENDSDEWSHGRRSASLSSDMSALSCVSVLPTEELDQLLEEVRSLGDGTLQNYNDVHVVVLHKEMGVGLGFSVAGGVDQSKPITVHRVFPLGTAAQEGSIREGDRVLSINGTALCGAAHWEALRILRKARTRGTGVVVLRKEAVSPPSDGGVGEDPRQTQTTPSADTYQRVCVKLEKLSRDLGFSLEGGVGSRHGDKPLSIQKIFQGGPVGVVYPGDEVLEIQGVSAVGMRRLEAWTFIKGLPPGPVEVVLHRPLKLQQA